MRKYRRFIAQLFPIAVLGMSLFVIAVFTQRVDAQEVQNLYPMQFRNPGTFTSGARPYFESWFGEAVREGTYPTDSIINDNYALPTSPVVVNYPTTYVGSRYHTSNFYEAVAIPTIPACAQNIRIAVTGPSGDATNRYSVTRIGSNSVGVWGESQYNGQRDYPEGALVLYDDSGFAASDRLNMLAVSDVVLNGVLTFSTNDISVTRDQIDGGVRLYTYVELRDEISNEGKQFQYQVAGSPYLRVKYDRSRCPNYNNAECEVFTGVAGFPSAQSGYDVAVANVSNDILQNAITTPGTQVRIGIRFKNTGSAPWSRDGGGRYGAEYTGGFSSNITMSSVGPPDGGAAFPVVAPSGGAPWRVIPRSAASVPTDVSTIFWFGFTVPSNFSGASINASWQMSQFNDFNGQEAGKFGERCDVTIRFPKNQPYLAVGGGDVISGARFASAEFDAAGTSCQATSAASNAPIKTSGYYDTQTPTGLLGSSMSQYAVFASGAIGDDSGLNDNNNFIGNFGYVRPGIDSFNDRAKDAVFAHFGAVNPGQHGNFYSNQVNPPLPCVDIRELEGVATATDGAGATAFLTNSDSGVYYYGGGPLNVSYALTPITIPLGTKKTIIVDDVVHINGNITYASYNFGSTAQIPSLTIIARNIHIKSPTHIVDANLIAMPRPSGVSGVQIDGVIDTCGNVGGVNAGDWYNSSSITVGACYKPPPSLVINGQVAARRILWKRTGGTLGNRDGSVYGTTCYFANYGEPGGIPILGGVTDAFANAFAERTKLCAAELVDFPAEQYIARFNATSVNVPAATVELPPIY